MTTSPPTSNSAEQGPLDLKQLTDLANQLFRDAPSTPPVPEAETGSAHVPLPERPATVTPTGGAAPSPSRPDLDGRSYGAQYIATTKVPEIRTMPTSPNPVAVAATAGPSYYFLDHASPPASARSASVPVAALPGGAVAVPPFDLVQVQRDFPILSERVHGKRLVWLDNAATTQKPRQVIQRLQDFYEHENSNIHRAAHTLAARATDAYEGARTKLQGFLNAAASEEIVFVRGATEAINLVANSWGRANVGAGDEIILSHLEHHANIVPWQMLCTAVGAKLRVIPVDDDGQVLLAEYGKLLGPRTKLVSFTHVSNALGTVTPAREMIAMARRAGARTLLDGAQSVSHMPIDVQSLGCDWFVLSGHKIFGPTGIGVLYGRRELLDAMPPWQGGGNMIVDVTFESSTYQAAPGRFEAGTGNIADAVGLGAAIDYLSKLGMPNIARYEHQLLAYGTRKLQAIPGLRLIGTAPDKASVLSFVMKGWTNAAIGKELDRHGIAVRSGHHCAQPILRRFGLESTVRPSLALYNTCADIDALAGVLETLAQRPASLRS